VTVRALPVVVFGLLVGWGVGHWAGPQLLAGLTGSSLARVNYRRRVVVAGLGLLLPLGLLTWAAPLVAAVRLEPFRAARIGLLAPSGLAVVVAGLAFCLLGLVDDLVEDAASRGFRGHLRALAAGTLTGGGVKLLGGAVAALVVAGLAGPEGRSGWWLPVEAAVVASAANVANLLDLRPGRCAKVFLPLWGAGCLLDPPGGAWSAGLAGAGLAAVPLDLREEGMLGDAGANALGAVVGTLLLAGPVWLLLAAAAVLLGLQLASERVSFTRVIEGNRILRAADRLGRHKSLD
jgi:UDP-N-acetylmuramyl pentapeptide phosphotransferase/UDP-N-acetylglucosamine-1-phosphate transferase